MDEARINWNFNEINLILPINGDFFKFCYLEQDLNNTNTFRACLKPVVSLRRLLFKRVLLGYPYIRTIVTLLPTPNKSEYLNLYNFLFPKEIFSNQKNQYLQLFKVDSEFSYCVYYQVSQQGKKFIKKLPLGSTWSPLASFFLKKFYSQNLQQNQNISIFFNEEVIFIQKYMASFTYQPNFSNLPFLKFSKVATSLFPTEVNLSYFFNLSDLTPTTKKPEKLKFFSIKDFLNNTPPVTKIRYLNFKQINPKILLVIIVYLIMLFSSTVAIKSFYQLSILKKELKEQRVYANKFQNTGQKAKEISVLGEKILHKKLLVNNINKQKFSAADSLTKIDNWLPKTAWVTAWEETNKFIKINIFALENKSIPQNQQALKDLFKDSDVKVKNLPENKKAKKNIFVFEITLVK